MVGYINWKQGVEVGVQYALRFTKQDSNGSSANVKVYFRLGFGKFKGWGLSPENFDGLALHWWKADLEDLD
jgi:hypothetical protein